ncbi:hypothetical protein QR680_007956 [Steinernema hermaphroditum]|uniref:Uncharacterized protein n=1 Tax=Steinernema hermaphroditum TaxID=289476 RepID=A0AA39M782_9BILA|nr:hypothetical protein QR680_007956 [Steinernema hermaphroditum]
MGCSGVYVSITFISTLIIWILSIGHVAAYWPQYRVKYRIGNNWVIQSYEIINPPTLTAFATSMAVVACIPLVMTISICLVSQKGNSLPRRVLFLILWLCALSLFTVNVYFLATECYTLAFLYLLLVVVQLPLLVILCLPRRSASGGGEATRLLGI